MAFRYLGVRDSLVSFVDGHDVGEELGVLQAPLNRAHSECLEDILRDLEVEGLLTRKKRLALPGRLARFRFHVS